jgi:Co/Zn/Cd efflux system component
MAVDAAFLHALSDMIMSIGVCIAAGIIEGATYKYGFLKDANGDLVNSAGTDCLNYWT